MCQSVYQVALLMTLSYVGPDYFGVENKSVVHNTIVFNSFIFCQLFNEYTARNLGNVMNPFKGIQHNTTFLYVSLFSLVCQILLVEFGGVFNFKIYSDYVQIIFTNCMFIKVILLKPLL